MHWVIQSNMFAEEGFERLVMALEELGVGHSIVKVVPFSHDLVPDIQPPDALINVMGTYTLVDIARKRGWFPGSFDNSNFNYKRQSYEWRGAMLNGGDWTNYQTIGEMDERPSCLYDDPEPSFFIRPVLDTKSFIGHITDWNRFQEWRKGVLALTPEDGASVNAETEVLWGPVHEIWREYRLWVVDGVVVTSSMYRYDGRLKYETGCPPWVTMFAEDQIRRWVPARAFVMDVAETPSGLKIIEVNNLNCAGFYGGRMRDLVRAIEGMVW